MVNTRSKPAFKRWMSQAYSRVSSSWRKPRGRQSKVRIREAGKIRMPAIGWGAKKETRGVHPSGFREIVVRSLRDLEKVDAKAHAIKIAHTVGKKKREEIVKKAKELKAKILNE
jgi:large subunit ribosomal protein L32e